VKSFARITAIIFMIVGVIIIMIGVGISVNGFTKPPTPASSPFSLVPNLSALLPYAGIVAGVAVGFQGLLLAAVGQVLWFMAGIAGEMEKSIDYMAELVSRMGNASR
jgi:hypothetical protein